MADIVKPPPTHLAAVVFMPRCLVWYSSTEPVANEHDRTGAWNDSCRCRTLDSADSQRSVPVASRESSDTPVGPGNGRPVR